MFDWASFLSGVLGATLGGGVTLVLALVTRRDQRRSNLRPLVREINSALKDLAAARGNEGLMKGSYGPVTSSALIDARYAIAELPLHAGSRGRTAATWVDLKMAQILHTEDVMERVNALLSVSEYLAGWVGGTTSTRSLRSSIKRINRDPEHMANRPPSSAGQ